MGNGDGDWVGGCVGNLVVIEVGKGFAEKGVGVRVGDLVGSGVGDVEGDVVGVFVGL